MSFVEAGHLGGYIPGGDDATYYPDLWDWLVLGDLSVKSVLDVGCGDGVALHHFKEFEIVAYGVEGVPQPNELIACHDYTKGPFLQGSQAEYDLIWCCEFVEHVEEQFVPNFLESFKRGKIVLMTHAMPGQQGYHHVNCQPPKYWIDRMREIGFELDVELTFMTRSKAASNSSPWNHYVRSGLAFRRN